MKAKEVALVLAANLPKFTDYFTSNFGIVSMLRVGTTVTVQTDSDHDFHVGSGVSIVGTKVPIAISSFTRVGEVGTIETTTDHDFTFGQEIKLTKPTVDVEGANETEFNGSFEILAVKNRRNVIVKMADAGATAATGSPVVTNGSNAFSQYNGLKQVTAVPSADTFQFEEAAALPTPIIDGAEARGNARVAISSTFERVEAMYTEQPEDNLWAFVVLENVAASKDRNTNSDAVSNTQRGSDFRQTIIKPVSIYVFIPATFEISGGESRDIAEELFRPICQSILFRKFDSGLSQGSNSTLQFQDHGVANYNTAYYSHQYLFSLVAEIQFEDTVGYSEDFAFRDIMLEMDAKFGEDAIGRLASNINLDEEPI